ncbi:hypothetical protein [Egicoccus sp. AB-alg2]|uniref:hypothetical protein n=1 Tax=Egicoccus sp. AB-alg2 TaxID=3242693 RepID=UPI00359D2853
MDPITLLRISHVEQGIARERAAFHNAAVRRRRDHRSRRWQALTSRFTARRAPGARAACTTC